MTNGAPAWVNAKGLDPSLFPYTDGRKVLSTRTNNWDQVIDICMMPNGRTRKVVRDANLANENAENGFVVKKLQLTDVVDTEMSPSADFAVSRLNLQGMAAGERCIVKSVKLR